MIGLFSATAVDGAGMGFWCGMAAFGLAIGVLTGLFGVGGGFMIVPLLNLLFGVPYEVAVGSSLSFTIGTGASGTARHLRLGNVELRSTLIMAAGAVVGAWGGAMLHVGLKALLRGDGPADFDLLMKGLFIALLVVTAWLVWSRRGDEYAGASLLQRLPIGPRVDLPAAGLAGVSVPGLLLIGLAVGVLKGLLGIGGGVLFMPILIVVVGLRPHQAVGTSLGVVLLSSVAGTIKHGLEGHVNLAVVMVLLAGSTIGVQAGAWLCQRLHATRLRRYFALLVLAVVAALVWDLLGQLLAAAG